MANSNNKKIYIIIGIVGLMLAIPVVALVVVFLAGFIFYQSGAN